MIWERLKKMKCPKCAAVLIRDRMYAKYRCSGCEFWIKEKKYNDIVNGFYKPEDREEDNLEQLNNL